MTAPANFITFLGGSIFRNGRKTIQVIVTVINIMNRFSAFFKSETCTISGKVICISFTITCGGCACFGNDSVKVIIFIFRNGAIDKFGNFYEAGFIIIFFPGYDVSGQYVNGFIFKAEKYYK